jgi:isopentenyl diphosphate isomerase/L-lactate dehydrogenase-like FMN-dependent dehydrogenase
MTDLEALRTIDQVVAAARAATDPAAFDWAAAGAGESVTVARNRMALNRLALVPKLLRDVSSVSTSTSFVGIPLALPVILAPVAALGLYDPGDAVSAGRAAAAASSLMICSNLTSSVWDEVAVTAPGRNLYGMYVLGDRTWLAGVVDHVESAGFGGICVTIDTARIGRRDRAMEGYEWRPPKRGLPSLQTHGPWDNTYRARYTPADLEWLCARTELPVIAKGIMTADDARTAIDCGVAAVYVSNHGGRQVDHELSSIEVLAEVVEAVSGDVEVVVDGGFMRGPEIIKGLALGADVVAIGRLQCWGLAAAGVPGLVRVFEILAEELEITMANLGAARLEDLTPDHVRWSFATT